MVKPAIHQEAECLADWYKMAQTIFLQTQILEKDLVSYEDSIYELKDRLNRIKEELKSENVDPKKNVSSMFKESSMAVRKRLEISSNVKVSILEFTSCIDTHYYKLLRTCSSIKKISAQSSKRTPI